MRLLDWLIGRTFAISRGSLWAAGVFMLVTVFYIGAEVILRKLGSAAVTGASEVGGYMLATVSVWAFSYTLLTRGNIRFDVLYTRCGPRVRAILDLVSLVALGAFMFSVTFYAFDVLARSVEFQSRSTSSLAVPLWIPQSVWFAGLLFLCWTLALLSLRVLFALVQQDLETVSRLAGIKGGEERFERAVEKFAAAAGSDPADTEVR